MDYSIQDMQALAEDCFHKRLRDQLPLATHVNDYGLDFQNLPVEGYYRMDQMGCPGMVVLIHELRPLVLVVFVHDNYTAIQLHSTNPALVPNWEQLPTNIKRRFWDKLDRFTLEPPQHLRLVKA